MPRTSDPTKDKLVFQLRKAEKMSWNEIVTTLEKSGWKMGRSTVRDAFKREQARKAKK